MYNNYKENEHLVEVHTRLRYRILYVAVDSITIVGLHTGAMVQTLPVSYVRDNFEPKQLRDEV